MPRGALEKAKVATWYLTIKGAIKLHFLHRLILLLNSGEKCLSKIIPGWRIYMVSWRIINYILTKNMFLQKSTKEIRGSKTTAHITLNKTISGDRGYNYKNYFA